MLKKLLLVGACIATFSMSGCQGVEPNKAGVLMQNYGKDGKADFQVVSGKVYTFWFGTELYTIPLFEQRYNADDVITLKSGIRHNLMSSQFIHIV